LTTTIAPGAPWQKPATVTPITRNGAALKNTQVPVLVLGIAAAFAYGVM
jgi:hypothetical protein